MYKKRKAEHIKCSAHKQYPTPTIIPNKAPTTTSYGVCPTSSFNFLYSVSLP